MARELKYFYRACFKPESLDVFKGFHSGLQQDGRGLGYAQVWHRGNVEKFTVVNEFVGAEVGRFLRLPIPPFAITYHDKSPLFSSLDFNFSRAKLPPVDADRCLVKLPELAAGVLIFDILIANEDRHEKNLVTNSIKRPAQLHVFDHDQCLFGGFDVSGLERLEKRWNDLGIVKHVFGKAVPHVFLKKSQQASIYTNGLIAFTTFPLGSSEMRATTVNCSWTCQKSLPTKRTNS